MNSITNSTRVNITWGKHKSKLKTKVIALICNRFTINKPEH